MFTQDELIDVYSLEEADRNLVNIPSAVLYCSLRFHCYLICLTNSDNFNLVFKAVLPQIFTKPIMHSFTRRDLCLKRALLAWVTKYLTVSCRGSSRQTCSVERSHSLWWSWWLMTTADDWLSSHVFEALTCEVCMAKCRYPSRQSEAPPPTVSLTWFQLNGWSWPLQWVIETLSWDRPESRWFAIRGMIIFGSKIIISDRGVDGEVTANTQ